MLKWTGEEDRSRRGREVRKGGERREGEEEESKGVTEKDSRGGREMEEE